MQRLIFLGCAALLASPGLLADEGMWTLDNFPRDTVRDNYGVDITQEWLDRVRLATTRIEGGCTGSFVSPDGLILTNHHCVRRCLSQISSAERDAEQDGFLAREHSEEARCEAEQISVLVDTQDITAEIQAAVAGKSDTEANEAR